MQTDGAAPPGGRRSDATRNRERILVAAREAFDDPGMADSEVSMALIARRSGLGTATLYRHFASRRELLEALYLDEVYLVCAAATDATGTTDAERLATWLRRFFEYFRSKRHVAGELLGHIDAADPVFSTGRARVLDAGQTLLRAAQASGEIDTGLGVDQLLDLVAAIATIPSDAAYVDPILHAALAGPLSAARGGESALARAQPVGTPR